MENLPFLELTVQFQCNSLYSVDNGSPAEEAGLQVGDQVMDVNGHSFVSIVHQEAVHILRSYKNLILTIKVTWIDSSAACCLYQFMYIILCRALEEYQSLHLKPMYPRPLYPKVAE